MKRKEKEKRRGRRVAAALPVALEGQPALSRDVSASGIFLETEAGYALGSPVSMALDLDTPWGKVMFRCEGRIVRVEHREDKVGVAVKFTDDDASQPGFRRTPE
jgi:hypothetical protein